MQGCWLPGILDCTKQPSHVTPGFKLSHLCTRGPLEINRGTVDGERMGNPTASRAGKLCCW